MERERIIMERERILRGQEKKRGWKEKINKIYWLNWVSVRICKT